MRRRIVIVLIVAGVAGLGLAQYLAPVRIGPAMQVEAVRTSGVLKDLREPGWLSSSNLKQATVVLADGSTVEASVIPGCDVRTGQSVHVDVLAGGGAGSKAYLVVGAI